MKQLTEVLDSAATRRSFLKNSMVAGAVATVGAGILGSGLPAFARETSDSTITKGDIDILRFLAAAEIIETDLWEQYTELGGVQDSEESGVNGGSPLYMSALQILDGDMSQYIHDNTDDERSHQAFINAFLESIGAEPVDLESVCQFAQQQGDGSQRCWAAHQLDESHSRHQLLDTLSQRHPES